jgi:hypothetical protein
MKLKVICYSGYKGEETPRAIIINDIEYMINEIIRRERVEDINTGERENIYWCKIDDRIIKLSKSLSSGEWRIKNE